MSKWKAPPRIAWLLLALLLLGPRLGLLTLQLGRPLQGDEISYDHIARNVSAGRGFATGTGDDPRVATAARGPAYVLLIAAIDAVFGATRTPLFVLQILMDALSLLLLVRLTFRWFGSWWIAWVAGVLYAVYPAIIQSSVQVLTETMTQLLVLVWLTFFVKYYDEGRGWDLALAAIALGIGALNKPQLALLGPVACIAAWPKLRHATWKSIAIVTAVVTLTMAPWIVRNAAVFHTFIPGVSIGGMGILFGSGAFDGRTVGSLAHPAVPDSVRAIVASMDEVAASRWAGKLAMQSIARDPAAYARLSVLKVARLWLNLGFDEGRPSRRSLLIAALNLGLVALALFGARFATDPVAPRLVLLCAICWTLVHIPFFANVRYVIPVLMLCFPFAAASLCAIAGGFHTARRV